MNAIARQLAEGLDIVREAKVVEASRLGDAWQVAVENQSNRRARTLVLTAPVPQSLALLQAGNTALPSELSADLVRLTYHPCIALLLLLDGPSAVPAEGVAYDGDGPVRWIADNTRKGVAPHVPAAVTVHLGRSFSAAHYTAAETDLLPHVMPTLGPLLGSAIKQVTVHRWKFSEPVTCHHEACVWRPEIGLGLAGDAFGGPKVEGAALSALALADRILQAR
jgi:predicted NAD/FAD-dependent oxidoreductase